MKRFSPTTMTKSEQIAQLLLRPEGCTFAAISTAVGWTKVNIPWHAYKNGLRLRTEKINGQPKRYFGERRKIEVRKVVKPWQPPAPAPQHRAIEPEQEQQHKPVVPVTPLAAFCAANDFVITKHGNNRILRCQHCYVGFKGNFVNSYLSTHIQRHAAAHRRHKARKETRHEQRGQLAQ